ncbi:hypothetical protein AB4267_10830 [Vibrio cyclitrophicus]
MNNRSFLSISLLLFLFFPYVGVVNGIDTQPNFILLCFAITPVLLRTALPLNFTIICLLSLSAFLLSFILHADNITWKYALTYLFILLNIYYIKWAISAGLLNLNATFITVVLACYVFVGLVQLYEPSFLAGVVTRGVDAVYTFAESNRGVRSLSPEPATLGKVINILFVFFVFQLATKHPVGLYRKVLFTIIVFFFILALVPRSAYALMMFIIIVIPLIYLINRRTLFITLMLLLSVTTAFLVLYPEFQSSRIYVMFKILLEEPSLLLQQGAMRRVLNIPISINNLLYFGPFGASNDPARVDAVLHTPIGQLHYEAFNRNLGGFIEIVLKFGLLSLPIMMLYGHSLYRILTLRLDSCDFKIGYWLCYAVLVITFQDGSPALALTWFLLLYLSSYRSRHGS